LEEILRQEEIYPGNYIKMRNLENHDFGRFAPMVHNDPHKIDNWTAFTFFLKGSTMIYGGQEFSATSKPSLFDKEDVQWDGRDLSGLITKMADIQQMDALTYGALDFHIQDKDVIVVSYRYGDEHVLGVFNVGNETGSIQVPLADGSHLDLISGTKVAVIDGTLTLTTDPIVLVL
jgi:glycosidase